MTGHTWVDCVVPFVAARAGPPGKHRSNMSISTFIEPGSRLRIPNGATVTLRSGLRRTWRWMFASIQHIVCHWTRTRKKRQSTCESCQPLWGTVDARLASAEGRPQHRRLSRQARTNERVARPKRLPTLVFLREKRQSMARAMGPMEKV
jgi:hypothetical protein